MKTPKLTPAFDHQVFDLSLIGTALRDLHQRLATPMGGFPAAPFMVSRQG